MSDATAVQVDTQYTVDEAAQLILVAHQRRDFGSCLCGWSGLGRSHPGHQVAKLHESGLLKAVSHPA